MKKEKFEVTIEPSLEKFLREKRVLTRFKKNVKNYRKGKITAVYARSIGSAFIWYETSEGQDFWNDLHDEFEEERNNHYKLR